MRGGLPAYLTDLMFVELILSVCLSQAYSNFFFAEESHGVDSTSCSPWRIC